MSAKPNALFKAFADDHALLGRGFFELSQTLRSNDIAAAQRMANRLNREAGAHIAFEEENFYPALRKLIGEDVDRFYDEHAIGRELIETLLTLSPNESIDETMGRSLLQRSESMEAHISECGDLFEAMGRIPPEDQDALFAELLEWRRKKPKWLDFDSPRRRAT